MLPAEDVQLIRDLCQSRSPAELADQVRVELEVDRGSATIVEAQAPWRADLEWTRLPVARLRFAATTNLWTLDIPQTNERWRRYEAAEPTADIRRLLREIDQDPTGRFWG